MTAAAGPTMPLPWWQPSSLPPTMATLESPFLLSQPIPPFSGQLLLQASHLPVPTAANPVRLAWGKGLPVGPRRGSRLGWAPLLAPPSGTGLAQGPGQEKYRVVRYWYALLCHLLKFDKAIRKIFKKTAFWIKLVDLIQICPEAITKVNSMKFKFESSTANLFMCVKYVIFVLLPQDNETTELICQPYTLQENKDSWQSQTSSVSHRLLANLWIQIIKAPINKTLYQNRKWQLERPWQSLHCQGF